MSAGRHGRRKPPKLPGFKVDRAESPKPPDNLPADNKATLTIAGQEFNVKADDLEKMEELGRGAYGFVEKVKHGPSGTIMAVKRIRAQVNSREDKRIVMDMDVAMRSSDCEFTVTFYGAMFQEGDVWICMEVLDMSLDKFYRKVYEKNETIPEEILGYMAYSIVKALHYLQTHLKVIHRDVKPSNVLIDRGGHVKMCDFGISGHLVDSVAKTMDAGCKPYMAPERIDPEMTGNQRGYDIKSDVWSLGITMYELCTGKFPYESWGTPFAQLRQVVKEPSPKLPEGQFSTALVDFIDLCLKKDFRDRPTYPQLMEHRFISPYETRTVDVASYVKRILD
ncbi:dual specificity mitogen-activated protein kinase kinase 6-like [Glandiceps talaboti]